MWWQLVLVSSVSAASVELTGSTFRILHVSDAHYHSAQEACRDVAPSAYPCTHENTTAFLLSVIALEQPHMIAFTGDIIDEASGPRPRQGMDDVYRLADELGLPWAASLGNHEDVVPGMTRDKIYAYILKLPGLALSAHGPIANSPGNFHVEIGRLGTPIARLVFFDSRNDDRFVNASTHSITDAQARTRTHPHASTQPSACKTPPHSTPAFLVQLDWFSELSATLLPVPTLAFYHIPLNEYRTAISAGAPISGSMREAVFYARTRTSTPHTRTARAQQHTHGVLCCAQICADKPNPRTFSVLKAGGVVGGFCGHDHTNDFCARWEGVQLCYEGSPGFGAYGACQNATCYQRRVRVTELALSPGGSALASIHSWKRLDGGGSVAGPMIDDELLWATEPREPVEGDAGLSALGTRFRAPQRKPISAFEVAGLVRKAQRTVSPAGERAPFSPS